MGTGQDILNKVIDQGKYMLKEFGKKIAKSLLTNPYFYLAIGIFLVIIVIAGSMIEVNAEAASNTNGMTSVSVSTSSMEQFIKFLHKYEGGGTIYQNSSGVDCYKVLSDGSPTGSAVGYGVDIGTHGEELRQLGYDTSIGSLIPVDVVDAIELRIRESMYQQVKDTIDANGITLTEYQLYALVSRAYNCGVAGALTATRGSESLDFSGYYNKYWSQSEDNKYGYNATEGDFNHKLYTEYMCVPVTSQGEYLLGLERRRKSEWTLFQTGYYDTLGEYWQESYTGKFNNINVYNIDGTVNEEKIKELQLAFESEFNLVKGNLSGNNIGGRYNKDSCTKVKGTYLGYSGRTGSTGYNDATVSYIANNGLGIYQCTWWANGRASEYLSKNGTKYTSYPSARGNGGEIYDVNQWFNSGSMPKPNSLVSYTSSSSEYGHVAYVEAVDTKNKCYYISHAGSGNSWFGIQKVTIGKGPWGWNVVGFVYLDEPL